ncbi:PTS sugar transporter subunit IIC [Allofustis seminis]|uniref:PTS sugar transporter subunit IIC n=1 Tax=Allofustis seminis TaxID=166939 RepID=UPI00037F4793|nr:PTS transporter subunit EIIC [Allofustis seminis]
MEKKMERNFVDYLNEHLIPIGQKISNQRHLAAIKDGMVAATPLALVGGMTLIVTSPPVNLETMQPTNIFFKFLIMWKEWAVANGLAIELLFRASIGMIAFFVGLVIATSLAKSYKIDPIGPMITSGVAFLIAAAPSNLGVMSTTIQEGQVAADILVNQTMVIPMSYLGSEGLFTAILIGLGATEIVRFFKEKRLIIKMPDAVPAPVKASFENIVPLAVVVIGTFLLSLTVQNVTGGLLIPQLVGVLFQPLSHVVNSWVGIIIISIVTQLLWFVGLHGSSIVSGIVGIYELGNLAANSTSMTQGMAPEFIYTETFRAFFMILGGAGATIGLNLLMLRSQSEQLKKLGRLAIVPSLFNINEPIIFGTPLVLNINLLIPFVLVQTVNGMLTYIVMATDLIKKTVAYVPWTTPAPLGAMITTYDWKAFIWVSLLIIVDMVIWYPFFKSYEKQLLSTE